MVLFQQQNDDNNQIQDNNHMDYCLDWRTAL